MKTAMASWAPSLNIIYYYYYYIIIIMERTY